MKPNLCFLCVIKTTDVTLFHRITEAQNTRLEKTLRIVCSKISWQKHGLENMTQHPTQLNLESDQHWGTQHFPEENILVVVIIAENFPLVSNQYLPRRNIYSSALIFSMQDFVKRSLHHLLPLPLNTGTQSPLNKAEQTRFCQPFFIWLASQSLSSSFMAFLWTPTSPNLFILAGTKTEHSISSIA